MRIICSTLRSRLTDFASGEYNLIQRQGLVLPSIAMDPQAELQKLLDRQESLKQELKEQKKELPEAQRLRKDTLKRQIHRAQSRISAAERKRRTRRLILMGSYLEHVTGNDPDKRDRLIKGLDVFLERDRDRELFDLAPKGKVGGHSDRACRAGRESFGHTRRLEPQPRGAVTRRAVAQRRSRASGLTRLSA